MPVHAVVGDFRRRVDAGNALAALTRAGFPPESISAVADDAELAQDLGGRSYVRAGVLAGVLAGIAFAVYVFVESGASLSPGFVVGALGVIGGLGFIGVVFGRSIVQRAPDAPIFASAVERGDVLVEVKCTDETCRHARDVLLASGAADVRNEESPGPT